MNITKGLVDLLTKEFDLGRHSDRWHGGSNELKDRATRVNKFMDTHDSGLEQDRLVPPAGLIHDNGW